MNNIWSIYGLASPSDKIIRYVGKSKNPTERLKGHLKDALKRDKGTYLCNWLRKLSRDGLKPVIVILETGSEEGWQDAERRWIAFYPPSQLTNHSQGGEGGMSGPNGKASREKLSRTRAKSWEDPEYRARMSRESKRFWKDPEYRERKLIILSENSRRLAMDPATKERASKESSARWKDPEFRAKMLLVLRANNNQPHGTWKNKRATP